MERTGELSKQPNIPTEQKIPFYNKEGVLYSVVPRNREMERKAGATAFEPVFDYLLEGGAVTQFYVVRINRTGFSPDSPHRDPRAMFLSQNAILETQPLAQQLNAARLDIIGMVTGPYVGQEYKSDEWHGLFLVSRGSETVPTFGELTDDEMSGLHDRIKHALDFMRLKESERGFVGFSFSPFESRRRAVMRIPDVEGNVEVLFPRSPVQNLSTIHGHIVMTDLKYTRSTPKSPVEKFDKRMAHEPKLDRLIEIFRELVYKDVREEFPDVSVRYAEHAEADANYPKGMFLIINDEELNNPRFAAMIRRLHERASEVYARIADVFVEENKMQDGIITYRSQGEIHTRMEELFSDSKFAALSDQAKRFIRLFGRLQEPNKLIDPEMSVADMARLVEKFVLLGMSYNIVYYNAPEKADQVVVAVVPRWLSGASPLETVGVYKDQYSMDSQGFATIMQTHLGTATQFIHYMKSKQEST